MRALGSRARESPSLHHHRLLLLQQIHKPAAGEAASLGCLGIVCFGRSETWHKQKYSSTCWFVGFWAPFPWGLCPCSAHRSFQETPGLTCAALGSLLLLQSTVFLGMDGHQWQTKRWREENATFRPSEGLFQVLGLWWGRVHIAAVILAVLWGITYNSVWHCRRLWTGSRYLELSCGAAVFSLCSLPQANALEKLELKIIQPFLEAKQRKIGNLFFPPLFFPF